jgi:hypothetical protein
MTSLLKTCSTEGAADVLALTWEAWIGIYPPFRKGFYKTPVFRGFWRFRE